MFLLHRGPAILRYTASSRVIVKDHGQPMQGSSSAATKESASAYLKLRSPPHLHVAVCEVEPLTECLGPTSTASFLSITHIPLVDLRIRCLPNLTGPAQILGWTTKPARHPTRVVPLKLGCGEPPTNQKPSPTADGGAPETNKEKAGNTTRSN